MKLVPGPLPPIPTGAAMDRLPLLPVFNPDVLWRYPMGFPSMGQPPSSPLLDYKSQLPQSLATDPRVWSRDDVTTFLRWAEREFDIQPLDMETFQMNGKAMCLLTRTDLGERAPGSGDVLYNVLQILVREANNLQRMLPSSPVTPTSRHPYPLSPHSHPPTPNWNMLTQNNSESFHSSHPVSLAVQLMAHSNSVTLSPAPSIDSQNSSPQHTDTQQSFGHSIFSTTGSNGSGSNPSDSDEDDKKWNQTSPPNTPTYTYHNHSLPLAPPRSPKDAVSSPGAFKCFGREFFPNDSPEPNTIVPDKITEKSWLPDGFRVTIARLDADVSPTITGGIFRAGLRLELFKFKPQACPEDATCNDGRLLWDFLQQLLNDPAQRYTNHIAWKNRETGVFKIVDPAGLAKLWGIQKNHLSMNYDKMSRALRYYYRVNILRKVQGERHCYQFLRNPTELKNIKNISLLRQQMTMSPTNTKPPAQQVAPQIVPQINIKHEPADQPQDHHRTPEYDDKPTDLSMEGPTDLSSGSRHVSIVCSPDPPISQN